MGSDLKEVRLDGIGSKEAVSPRGQADSEGVCRED